MVDCRILFEYFILIFVWFGFIMSFALFISKFAENVEETRRKIYTIYFVWKILDQCFVCTMLSIGCVRLKDVAIGILGNQLIKFFFGLVYLAGACDPIFVL